MEYKKDIFSIGYWNCSFRSLQLL